VDPVALSPRLPLWSLAWWHVGQGCCSLLKVDGPLLLWRRGVASDFQRCGRLNGRQAVRAATRQGGGPRLGRTGLFGVAIRRGRWHAAGGSRSSSHSKLFRTEDALDWFQAIMQEEHTCLFMCNITFAWSDMRCCHSCAPVPCSFGRSSPWPAQAGANRRPAQAAKPNRALCH